MPSQRPAGADEGQFCPWPFDEIAFCPSRTIAFVERRSCDLRRRDWLRRSAGSSATESLEQTVNYLIAHVAKSDAMFIRNGVSHTPTEAVNHIKAKYEHSRTRSKLRKISSGWLRRNTCDSEY